MGAINKMVATGVPNLRQRTLGDGDIAYYTRVGSSFTLVGRQSTGFVPGISEIKVKGQAGVNKLTGMPEAQVNEAPTLNNIFTRHKSFVSMQIRPTKHTSDFIKRYEKYIAPILGNTRLDKIESGHISKLYADIKREHSESLAYHVCHIIRYLYLRAREWGHYTGRVPMGRGTSFVLPMPQRKREEIYTKDELHAILYHLSERSQTVHDMVVLSLTTGMRLGEITKLQVCHVNPVTKRIKLVDPKGKKDTYVQLPQSTFDMIQERLGGQPTDHVFKDKGGKQIKSLSQTFRKVVADLGINAGVTDSRFKKSFHSLRHTFATELMASGQVSIIELRDLLGHKSVKTTERYTHSSERALNVASSFMDGFLG